MGGWGGRPTGLRQALLHDDGAQVGRLGPLLPLLVPLRQLDDAALKVPLQGQRGEYELLLDNAADCARQQQ